MTFPGMAFHEVEIRQGEIGPTTWPLLGNNQDSRRTMAGYSRRTVERNVDGLK